MNCRHLSIVLFIAILACALTACNSGDDKSPGLDGDLSVRIEGPSGLRVVYGRSLLVEGGFDIGGTSVTIPDGGTWTKDLKTDDLDGEPVGVRIEATTSSEEELTLQLLSDGEVVGKDAEPEQQDGDNFYVVEAGNTERQF